MTSSSTDGEWPAAPAVGRGGGGGGPGFRWNLKEVQELTRLVGWQE